MRFPISGASIQLLPYLVNEHRQYDLEFYRYNSIWAEFIKLIHSMGQSGGSTTHSTSAKPSLYGSSLHRGGKARKQALLQAWPNTLSTENEPDTTFHLPIQLATSSLFL